MTRPADTQDFEIARAQVAEHVAVYFPSMDYVDYVRGDGIAVYDRVDRFLTVIRDEDGEMVGFKLKGIKNFFLKKLQPALDLADEDFIIVRDLFVALATSMGEDLFTKGLENERRRSAYKRAVKIASEDRVKFSVPAEELLEAA